METITVDRYWMDAALDEIKSIMPTVHNNRYSSKTLSDEEYWALIRALEWTLADLVNMKHDAERSAAAKKSKFKFWKK